MPRQLPPLNALRAFEAAGRHQSFSRAAEELGVSHSAISRHVRGLEQRLKAQLFRDQPRGVVLTSAGAQFLAEISPAFDRIASAAELFSETTKGQVRINVEPLFATKWLMPRLAEFSQLYPEVELQIEATRILADMSRFEADLAIRFYNQGKPDQPAEFISDMPLYPYAAKGLINLPLQAPEDLLPFKLYQDRHGDMWQRWFIAAGGDASLVPEMSYRMRTALSVEAAANGMGVLLASSEIMELDVQLGRLEQISDVGIYHGSYHLLYGEGVARRRAVRVFRDWLLEVSAPLRGNQG